MTSPSVEAKKAIKKPPAAKPLRSRWIPDDGPTPRVNASYKIVLTCFSISGIALLEM